MTKSRIGWIKIDGERLSTFHRQLIETFPHYASVAVSEGMLPGQHEVLSYEERQRLGLLAEASPQCLYRGELPTVEGCTFEEGGTLTFDSEPIPNTGFHVVRDSAGKVIGLTWTLNGKAVQP